MERILEPELMSEEAQAIAYAEADFEEPHSNFIERFKEVFAKDDISGHILDLGCGPGDITFRFARAYPSCTVHGIDGSEAMLRPGQEILTQSSELRDRVSLFCGFLPGAHLPRSKYDVIISNSLLHHLPDPQILWNTIRSYGIARAPVFVMDLMRPPSIEQARALTELHTVGEPEILRRDFYNSLLAAFEIDEVREQLREAELDGLAVCKISDRHLLVSGYAP